MCCTSSHLNATHQVAPDEKTLDGLSILLLPSPEEDCCSYGEASPPLQSLGAGMPPCSPQSCHTEQFQMFLKRGRRCGGGGRSFWRITYNHGLTDQSSSELQYEPLSVPSRSWCPFYLLDHVFSRSAPSRRVLITGSITSPSPWRVTSSEKVCCVSLSPKLGSNKGVRSNLLTLITD